MASEAGGKSGPFAPRPSEPGAKSTAETATELEALRRQVSELSQQVQHHLSRSGAAALQRPGNAASGMMSDVGAKGREAIDGVREVTDHFTKAVDASLEKRPYTTLATAFALGFLVARLS